MSFMNSILNDKVTYDSAYQIHDRFKLDILSHLKRAFCFSKENALVSSLNV